MIILLQIVLYGSLAIAAGMIVYGIFDAIETVPRLWNAKPYYVEIEEKEAARAARLAKASKPQKPKLWILTEDYMDTVQRLNSI